MDTSASNISRAQEASQYELTPSQNVQRFLPNEGSILDMSSSQNTEENDLLDGDDFLFGDGC
jgi:hypothetical protein